MVKVTTAAKEQLARVVAERKLDPGRFLRLAIPPTWTGDGEFGIVIDSRTATDAGIMYNRNTVLLIDTDVNEEIPNSILDYKTPPEGAHFSLDVY